MRKPSAALHYQDTNEQYDRVARSDGRGVVIPDRRQNDRVTLNLVRDVEGWWVLDPPPPRISRAALTSLYQAKLSRFGENWLANASGEQLAYYRTIRKNIEVLLDSGTVGPCLTRRRGQVEVVPISRQSRSPRRTNASLACERADTDHVSTLRKILKVSPQASLFAGLDSGFSWNHGGLRSPSPWHSRTPFIAVLIIIFALTTLSCTKQNSSPGGLILFDFETDSDLDRFGWKCRSRFEISSDYSSTGKSSLRFEFHPAQRVGFSTGDVPHDWSSYKSFDFWVYNPSGTTVPLHLQINRREPSGRFNHLITKAFEIVPGPNKLSILLEAGQESKGDQSSLNKVDGFFIFIQSIPSTTVLYFDDFKLVNTI